MGASAPLHFVLYIHTYLFLCILSVVEYNFTKLKCLHEPATQQLYSSKPHAIYYNYNYMYNILPLPALLTSYTNQTRM